MSDEVMGGVPDFKDVKYIRPDLDKFTELVRGVRLKLMTAKTVEAADEAIGEYETCDKLFRYIVCALPDPSRHRYVRRVLPR